MTAAVGAERLFFHKWTPVAALTGVFGQSRALRTETRFGAMVFFTVFFIWISPKTSWQLIHLIPGKSILTVVIAS